MLCVLLIIGMMDQSGGLLFLSMYGLVAVVALQYRHHGVTMLAPLATVSMYWLGDHGLAYSFLDSYIYSDPNHISEIRVLLVYTNHGSTRCSTHADADGMEYS